MDGVVIYTIAILSIGGILLLAVALAGLVTTLYVLFAIGRWIYNKVRPQGYEVDLTGVKLK